MTTANAIIPKVPADVLALVNGSMPTDWRQHINGGGWVYRTATVADASFIGSDARVYGNAWVYGNARVYGNAQVYGDARVSGNAQVYGDARVSSPPLYTRVSPRINSV